MRFKVESVDRLDRALTARFPEISRTKLAKWIEAGEVRVDGQVILKPGFRLEVGYVVDLREPEETALHDLSPASIPLEIVYEDEDLLVVNKPRGLATHPAPSLKEPSLVNALLARGEELSQVGGDFRPGIVHRLDKETTGLLLVAKKDTVHVHLAKQIEQKTATREYLAVVAGEVLRDQFTIEAALARDPRNRLKMAIDLKGKRAVTHIERIRGRLLKCRLETGRTHQIRVHLASIGHPVLGDTLYAPKAYHDSPLQLHAYRLVFTHPADGRTIEVIAPPPPDFLEPYS